MRLVSVSVLALASIERASAYATTSPFLLVNSESNDFIQRGLSPLSSASTVQNVISKSLESCSSQYYLLISQPGISSSDLSNRNSMKIVPGLQRSWENDGLQGSRYFVNDVVGSIDTETWTDLLKKNCKAKYTMIQDPSSQGIPDVKHEKRIFQITFPTLSQEPEKRRRQMIEHDAYLNSLLEHIRPSEYTLLYSSSPRSMQLEEEEVLKHYEMDESPLVGVLHSDLKRDLGGLQNRQKQSNQTMVDGPLFAKYQFFTPGIFMTLGVGLILLMILYVGVSALASLQVTYGAFDKEQGQLANKKAQ